MRIIGQKGVSNVDLPYERVGVFVNNTDIIAFSLDAADKNSWILAMYSTEEKADLAMELLTDAYGAYELHKTMSGQERTFFNLTASNIQQEIISGVFRFPADDEIKELEQSGARGESE